jgi:superfamily II DNA or RNA helicase
VTTKQLVDQNVLVPLKVFISKEIDMTGAKKVAGEWSQIEATTRGMKITGDIVSEWVKKTHELFGKPVKTIVFCSGVNHGADLARKFAEQGYNFISVSYRDDESFKRDVIEDFAKPDTEIHGLIATDILTKGFDVPDVMIGISARPFSKSLSSHIQQMGRIMRGCEGKEFAVWLDHSGNYLRFRADWDDVFENGVHKLDDGKEKAKPEPTQKEKEAAKCPVCESLWPSNSDACSNCGHVRERKNKVIELPGELTELKGTMTKADKQEWWSMLQWYVQVQGWSHGRAAHTYKDKFGVWPRGLHDKSMPPTQEVIKFIDKGIRAYIRQMKRSR